MSQTHITDTLPHTFSFGDAEVTSARRGGQAQLAVYHGKSRPILEGIKIPSLPDHLRLNISDE